MTSQVLHLASGENETDLEEITIEAEEFHSNKSGEGKLSIL